MRTNRPVKNVGPVLAYPFRITDLRPVRRKTATRKPGRKRPFPGIKVRMMDFYVQELRACAEATGGRVRVTIHGSPKKILSWAVPALLNRSSSHSSCTCRSRSSILYSRHQSRWMACAHAAKTCPIVTGTASCISVRPSFRTRANSW